MSANLSVASINNLEVEGSREECPASGTMVRVISGHAFLRA